VPSRDPLRYVLLNGLVGAPIVNAILNGAIGFAVTGGLATFPVWGIPGTVPDLMATAFGVTFGTCLVVPLQVRRDLTRGNVTAPTASVPLSALLSRFPEGTLARSIVLGVVSVPLFCPFAVLPLVVLGTSDLSRAGFVALKAGFSALEAAVVTPVLLLAALLDLARRARPE
jgi:hypothetical protein